MTTRLVLKWIAAVASILWIAVTLYQEFLSVDPTSFGFRSSDVEAQMKACSGSFQQRYDCKEEIIINKGYDSFFLWVEKSVFVIGPPLVLAVLLGRNGRGRPFVDERAGGFRRSSPPGRRPASIDRYRVR